MMHRALLALSLSVFVFLMACGGGSTSAPEAKHEAKSEAPVAPAVDPAVAATIEGSVKFSGTKPVMKPLSMDATPACARQHSSPVMSEEVVVNDNNTLRNVFIHVKSGLPSQPWPVRKDQVTIDQVGCVYKPHVVGAMVGQEVKFLNSDPTNHNIHPMPRVNREWNESQPPQGDPKVKTFAKPEVMVPIKCNIHPWMRVYVGVVDNPFFAVTGEDGSFSLKGLPPGDYTLEAWHERYGTKEIKVKVGAKETAKAEFAYQG
ncbi:MAG: DUF2012 domain-containing protein [Bryobacterales bacterium]|nr:DUF2012 domain-containing protein [Bryobacterales bacterium]